MKFKRRDGGAGPWTPFNEIEPGVYEATGDRQLMIAAGFSAESLIVTIGDAAPAVEPDEETETEAIEVAEQLDPDDPGTEARP